MLANSQNGLRRSHALVPTSPDEMQRLHYLEMSINNVAQSVLIDLEAEFINQGHDVTIQAWNNYRLRNGYLVSGSSITVIVSGNNFGIGFGVWLHDHEVAAIVFRPHPVNTGKLVWFGDHFRTKDIATINKHEVFEVVRKEYNMFITALNLPAREFFASLSRRDRLR